VKCTLPVKFVTVLPEAPSARTVTVADAPAVTDDDPVTATFEYAWWMDGGNIYETNRVKSVTVTAPTVDAGRNGPGSAPTSIAYFDVVGRPIWTMDEDGFINYTAYDNASGGIIKQIVDVATTQTGTFANKPSGWTTPGGAGLHLTTTFDVARKLTSPGPLGPLVPVCSTRKTSPFAAVNVLHPD